MRTDIYYWKCDNPLSVEEKLIYNDKYRLADISELVRAIALDHFRKDPIAVEPTGSAGNHYTYLIKYEDQTVFFRADDGKSDDDYMAAECAAMELASSHGVPVPRVYATDTSKSLYPVRFQLMEKVPGENLNTFYQNETLDRSAVGRQVGRHLAAMHQIKLDGFGFFNTDVLRSEHRILGLDHSHGDYFYKRFQVHLRYIRDNKFLCSDETREIEELVDRHAQLLSLDRGSLVHKDIAFWNLVGTPSRVNAIVDWDDVIVGDPVDDLAIMKCFYHDDVFGPVLEGYQEVVALPEHFYPKLWLFLLRNMLWKTVIRIFMGYFEMKGDFFLLSRDNRTSLQQFTYDRLHLAVNELRKLS